MSPAGALAGVGGGEGVGVVASAAVGRGVGVGAGVGVGVGAGFAVADSGGSGVFVSCGSCTCFGVASDVGVLAGVIGVAAMLVGASVPVGAEVGVAPVQASSTDRSVSNVMAAMTAGNESLTCSVLFAVLGVPFYSPLGSFSPFTFPMSSLCSATFQQFRFGLSWNLTFPCQASHSSPRDLSFPPPSCERHSVQDRS